MNIFETSYTEYLRTKKSGLRREAMTALNVFLAACGNVDTASKRQIIKDFFTRQSAEDIEIACYSQLLFPVLAEWCAENPGEVPVVFSCAKHKMAASADSGQQVSCGYFQ